MMIRNQDSDDEDLFLKVWATSFYLLLCLTTKMNEIHLWLCVKLIKSQKSQVKYGETVALLLCVKLTKSQKSRVKYGERGASNSTNEY